MLGQHVREVSRERRQDGELEHALGRRVVDMLGQRDESGAREREDAKTLQGDHDVARPAIEGMNEHDYFAWIGLYIIEKSLKLRALGDLLPTSAALIVLKKDRLREFT
jgi:hypothetical protein